MQFRVAILLVSLGSAELAHATSLVTLKPSDGIQTIVNANPPGTKFLLKEGTYRLQSITPKDSNVFEGDGEAVLTGSKLLTGWQQNSNTWYVADQTQQGTVQGECQKEFPRCNRPDDVYLNDAPLRHVSTLAEVGLGTFFFDYDTGQIHIGDDPTGQTVEAAVTPTAFQGPAIGVTIKNLTIKKYATPTQQAVIQGGAAWVVADNIITLNHSLGVDANSGWQVLRNKIVRNGMAGFGGGGEDIVFYGNTIAENNYAGVNFDWEGGGGKITENARGAVIHSNCVHDNDGPGIWLDVNADGAVIEENRVFGNAGAGIMHEISRGGTIRNNFVANNGAKTSTWLWGSQILISSSTGVAVYGNTVDTPTDYGNAITIVSQDRAPYTPAVSNTVHNNQVTIRSTNFGVIGTASDAGDDAALSAGNRMYANTYYLADPGNAYWVWAGAARTFSEMRALGQEVHSTANGSLGPPPLLSCAFIDPLKVGDAVKLKRDVDLRDKNGSVTCSLDAEKAGAIIDGPIVRNQRPLWLVSIPSHNCTGWAPESALVKRPPKRPYYPWSRTRKHDRAYDWGDRSD